MSSIIPASHIPSSAQHWAYLHDCERYLGHIASIIAHILFFILLFRFFVFEPGVSDGISMAPTVRDNIPFLVEKISFLVRAPARGDIIQHVEPQKRQDIYIKRIVGLPGETITVKQNAVYISSPNKKEYALAEHYLPPNIVISIPGGMQRTFTLSKNEYFVLGDNRANSHDSRSYGSVHRKLITGRVLPIAFQVP